ncbi:hypothetical protein IQ264_22945 [Phormidium sp. LEGE 05292]|uniref:hypothetical protein n=1 Tax=[Phormidium] sp. LEGE 05292 TaxID=767427 RepID=UPI0018824E5A|nr:hypothetical protein [Phormidium sp. LEGE 05292]MBE9228285.1 hypothetical protein [Phormidium sp. LEGE 05292]
MRIDQILLSYSLEIFDGLEDLFYEVNEFLRSLVIQVEEELELSQEIKQTLNNEIKEKENDLKELEEEIIFCNEQVIMLNKDLIDCEAKIANLTKQGSLDEQDLNLTCVNLRAFQQDNENQPMLRKTWIEPELMTQMRIQSQAIRNHAKMIRHQSVEIRRNINYLKKELF